VAVSRRMASSVKQRRGGALIYLEPNKRKRTNTVSNRRSVT
jgi:hypothetical protein